VYPVPGTGNKKCHPILGWRFSFLCSQDGLEFQVEGPLRLARNPARFSGGILFRARVFGGSAISPECCCNGIATERARKCLQFPSGLSLYKRKGIYNILYYSGGKRHWKSTGVSTHPEALQKLTEFRELLSKRVQRVLLNRRKLAIFMHRNIQLL
jgi:hypothetical protein